MMKLPDEFVCFHDEDDGHVRVFCFKFVEEFNVYALFMPDKEDPDYMDNIISFEPSLIKALMDFKLEDKKHVLEDSSYSIGRISKDTPWHLYYEQNDFKKAVCNWNLQTKDWTFDEITDLESHQKDLCRNCKSSGEYIFLSNRWVRAKTVNKYFRLRYGEERREKMGDSDRMVLEIRRDQESL